MTPKTYSPVAKALHWSSSLLIITLLTLGFIATNIGKSPVVHSLFWWHKSLGLLLLVIMITRIIYRLTHPYPALLPAPKWQLKAASLTHLALYTLVVTTIIAGLSMSSFSEHQTSFFGLFNVRLPFPLHKSWAHLSGTFHYVIAWTLVVLIASHILAALYHHFIMKDDTLRRMTPK